MKRQKFDWLAQLHNKTMHGICSGVSEHKNEVANRIRFLAKFRQPRAIALGVASVLLLGVGAFCLGGRGAIPPHETAADALSLAAVQAIAAENAPAFTLSIAEKDGAEYYRLDAHGGECYLLLNAAQTELTIYSGQPEAAGAEGLVMPCITVFGNAIEAPATLAMQDLTGDGAAEFVFLHSTGGTGVCGTTTHIINPATLVEYPLPDLVAEIASQVGVEFKGHNTTNEGIQYLQCDVTYQLPQQSEESFRALVQSDPQLTKAERSDLSHFWYNPATQQGNWVMLNLSEDGLTGTVGVQIENQAPWEYVAMATAALIYDSDHQVFMVGDLQSVADCNISDVPEEYLYGTDTDAAATRGEYTSWMADLTHDGDRGIEEILWDDIAFAEVGNQPLYVQSADMCNDLPRDVALWQSSDWQSVSRSHAGHITYSLYHDDAGDYLLRYTERWYSGSCNASYDLFSLSETGVEIIAAQGSIEILGEEMPYNGAQNDVEEIVSFLEAVAGYSANSAVLVSSSYDLAYCDAATGEVVKGVEFIKGTVEQPIRFIPFMMEGYVTAQDDAGRQATVEALRARLIEINTTRAEAYQEIVAAQQAQNAAAMAEYGMIAPFRAERTYDTWVADSYNADPEGWQASGVAYLMQQAQGTTVTDKNGNKVRYSLAVTDLQSGTQTTDYNSNLRTNETYWSGFYYGDLPGAVDKIYYDFYYYADFQSMLEGAPVLPQGANVQLTVDTSAAGSNKKVRMIAYTCYASDGTRLGFEQVFYADAGEDGVLTLEIPALDYQGEQQMMMQFHIGLADDTIPNPEDYLKFSLPCKQN